MNRFWRRELENQKIPSRVYDEARQRAWAQLSKEGVSNWRRWAVAASVAIVLAAGTVWWSQSSSSELAPAQVAKLPIAIRGHSPETFLPPVGPISKKAAVPNSGTAEVVSSAVPDRRQAAVEEPVSMSFTLPRSRVRMLWIKQPRFWEEAKGEEE